MSQRDIHIEVAADAMAKMAGLVGIPYAEYGTDPRPVAEGGHGGVDCWGIVRLGLMALGVEVPADLNDVLINQRRWCVRLDASTPVRTGDVLVMHSRKLQGGQQHLALVIDAFFMLHTMEGQGVRSQVSPIAVYRRTKAIAYTVRPVALLRTSDAERVIS